VKFVFPRGGITNCADFRIGNGLAREEEGFIFRRCLRSAGKWPGLEPRLLVEWIWGWVCRCGLGLQCHNIFGIGGKGV